MKYYIKNTLFKNTLLYKLYYYIRIYSIILKIHY